MNQYYFLIPEIILLSLGIVSFFYSFIVRGSKATWILGFISIIIPIVLAFISFGQNESSLGLIKIDPIKEFLRILVFLSGLFVLALSRYSLREGTKGAEYIFLLILALFGMSIMILSNDLLLLYLSLEISSLSLYVLTAFYKDDRLSIEAGLKYFILGTISSLLLLSSVIFFYALTGSTSYEAFKLIKIGEFTMTLGLVFMISSFAFKLSLAPFHAWSPDVYQGAPTPITAFLSTAPKIAVFSVLINLFPILVEDLKIEDLIIVLSILSIFIGNLLALRQSDLKRMFAYSSIAHGGYIFMAFLLPEKILISSILPYLLVYFFMNMGAFAFIMAIGNGENINSYLGLGRKNPLIVFSIIVILFSLTGIPPTAGFAVKFNLFKNVFAAGYSGIVFFALFMSILSAFYYLRIVFYLYRDISPLQVAQIGRFNQSIALASALFLIITGMLPNLILI